MECWSATWTLTKFTQDLRVSRLHLQHSTLNHHTSPTCCDELFNIIFRAGFLLAPTKHSWHFELATLMSNNSQTCLTPVWATTHGQPHPSARWQEGLQYTDKIKTKTTTARCATSSSICCQSYQTRRPHTTREMDLFVVLEMGRHEKAATGCNHTVGHSFPVHFCDRLVGLKSVPRFQYNMRPQRES